MFRVRADTETRPGEIAVAGGNFQDDGLVPFGGVVGFDGNGDVDHSVCDVGGTDGHGQRGGRIGVRDRAENRVPAVSPAPDGELEGGGGHLLNTKRHKMDAVRAARRLGRRGCRLCEFHDSLVVILDGDGVGALRTGVPARRQIPHRLNGEYDGFVALPRYVIVLDGDGDILRAVERVYHKLRGNGLIIASAVRAPGCRNTERDGIGGMRTADCNLNFMHTDALGDGRGGG